MARSRKSPRCTALIADIVRSRDLSNSERGRVQKQLQALLARWNRTLRKSLLAKFTITTGDEFQGLLQAPECLPDVIRDLEEELPQVRFRSGIGFGSLTTDLTPFAIGMDGPAWHLARQAITTAKADGRRGGVFAGFGDFDITLSALASFVQQHFEELSPQQRRVAMLLRTDHTVTSVSEALKIPVTNVSRQKKLLNWDVLRDGEQAWRELLRRFNTTSEWSGQ